MPIYLWGSGESVNYIIDGSTLTEQDKQGAIIVESLPPAETPEGHTPILCLTEDNIPYWKYIKFEEEIELSATDRVENLEATIEALITILHQKGIAP